MNYDKQLRSWEKRRDLIKRLRAMGLSMAAIGRKMDISRQRVRQILLNGKR